jgi:hypothetical protein
MTMTAFINNPIVPRKLADCPRRVTLAATSTPIASWSTFNTATEPVILPSGETFEPILPASSTLIAFGSIIALSALAVWVWANLVVPVSRTNLALSKKNGPVKDYLDELRMAEIQSTTENDLVPMNITMVEMNEVSQSTNTRAFERWLFTDWLQKESKGSKKGRQKEPALPILKNAKWNSGDNPVLVASALIMGGVVLTAITERASTLLF